MSKLKVCELFAGIGGFRIGIEEALGKDNVEFVYVSEWDKYAAQTYEKNFGYRPDTRSITDVPTPDIPDHDLITGGVPCQAWSIAGKRGGFDDPRGNMWFECFRILRDKQPKYFLFENVKGLLSSKTLLTFETILPIIDLEIRKNTIWEKEFIPLNNWIIVADNISNYLAEILGKNSEYPANKLGISSIIDLGKISEKKESFLSFGLKKRLRYLNNQISPTIKKQRFLNNTEGQIALFGHSEEDLGSFLNQLSSIEDLNTMDMNILEKGIATLNEVELFPKNYWEENLLAKTLFTISMETKQTTDQKTYLFVHELNIILFIIKQWKLSNNLWKKILSNLIEIKKSTYYVKAFSIIINELVNIGYDIQYQILNSKNFGVPQNRERVFIIGHSRNVSRPEVFPLTGENQNDTRHVGTEVSLCLDANYFKGVSPNGFQSSRRQLIGTLRTHKDGQGFREIKSGLSPTIPARAREDGSGQPVIAVPVLTPDRLKKRQNGRRFKEDGEPSFTLTGQDIHGVYDGMQIRRLTPTECERLQGFPDGWTKQGIWNNQITEISDTQRYKVLGNAVTTNVVKEVVKRMFL